MPIRGSMGRVVARLLESDDEEQIADAIHDLERLVLSAPPASEEEAVLMLQVVASGLRAADAPSDYVSAVEHVVAWIQRSVH